jgi:hypothetical protein
MSDDEDLKIIPTRPKTRTNDAVISYKGFTKLAEILPILSEQAKERGKRSFYKSNSRGIAGSVTFTTQTKLQNSTVIVKYTTNTTSGLWQAHGNYLARENAQNTDKKGLGFNQDSLEVNIAKTLGD